MGLVSQLKYNMRYLDLKGENMTKKEQRDFARELMATAIGCAYYGLESHALSDDDEQAILSYLNKYGERACKAIGTIYVAY